MPRPLAPLQIACALLGASAILGCGRGPGEPDGSSSALTGASTFSREAFAPRGADAGSGELTVPVSADPAALAEILAAAPKPAARAPTSVDGGSAVGSETGVREGPPAAEAPSASAAPPAVGGRVGRMTVASPVSDQALELALRAQVYWSLTQTCRGPDQRLLPPEAVRIEFQVDRDGYLVPPTVVASAKEGRFAEAARCMARALSATAFRAPPAARGRPYAVGADVPPAD